MSDYTAPINLPDHKLGDRWVGMVIGPILIGAAQPAVTLARVRMHFRQGAAVYRLDSDATLRDAPITITNATTWIATIPVVESGFLAKAGIWAFDVEFWGTGQGPVTLLRGTMTVHTDVTK